MSKSPIPQRRALRLAVLFAFIWPMNATAQDVEAQWRIQHEAGLEALRQGRYEDAARSFRTAILEAEQLGPENYRLAESLGALAQTSGLLGEYQEAEALSRRSLGILERILHPRDPIIAIHRNNLAETYWRLGQPEDAEPLFRRALPVLEETLGLDHSDVLRSMGRLAAMAEERDDYREAEEIYERLLSARWGGGEEPSRDGTIAVLDNLVRVIRLAHFPDQERDDAIRDFSEILAGAVPDPVLFVASSRLLERQQMVDAAEDVMFRAVEAFPGSRRVRTELAELYANNRKLRSALDVFEAASQMEGPPGEDPAVQAYERRLLLVRIGHMNIELGQFDAAVAAFQMALEIAPDAMDARLELAGQYLVRDMIEKAEAEYARVVAASPETADAHYGLSELYLRLDRFAEAAQAAADALEVDPEHQRARYTRVRALARAGRAEEGRQELAEYQRREAVAAAAADSDLQVSAIYRSAASMLLEGRAAEAIELFRSGIEAQPDAALIYLNLGVALGKLGRGEAAVATFQAMLDRGCCAGGDSYLVHKSLEVEYGRLGDDQSSLRHRALYLREYDRALSAALEVR
jgi:tetratricopeptide (TPR) repeat protein